MEQLSAQGAATPRACVANGGFPEPPAGEPVRVVACAHEACGCETRVRLPWELEADVVRRVVCGIRERLPDHEGPAWRYGSVAVAAVAVVGALMLIQGGTGEGTSETSKLVGGEAASPAYGGEASKVAAGGGEQALATPAAAARLVRESSFSLALPAGWERIAPTGGSTFAASSADGGADATLWLERDSRLDLAQFETRSLAQLAALAGSAKVVDRVAAPTPEGTIITLAADAPSGGPRYEVVLRAAGLYRYYLATTLQAGASREAIAGVELIQGSFTPEARG